MPAVASPKYETHLQAVALTTVALRNAEAVTPTAILAPETEPRWRMKYRFETAKGTHLHASLSAEEATRVAIEMQEGETLRLIGISRQYWLPGTLVTAGENQTLALIKSARNYDNG